MSRNSLIATAAVLAMGIAAVPFAGFDNLPGGLRREIAAERQALAQSQKQLQTARQEVSAEIASQPDLFRARSLSAALPGRLGQAEASLDSVAGEVRQLSDLEKRNRRTDRDKVRSLLDRERKDRAAAVAAGEAVRKDAGLWLEVPRKLPAQAAAMERDYRAARAVDLSPVTAAVAHAGTDWPQKKADLDTRLAAVRALAGNAEQVWQSSAALRQAAASGNAAGLDYAALFSAADTLHAAAADLPRKSEELKSLTGQLYNGWDKLLVDMEERGFGKAKEYNQKIRTVRTHVEDAAARKSTILSDEKWIDVDKRTYDARRGHLGMVVEHKAAGCYDSEAETVAQPAGFAYVATPSQQSNQYGYWEHRDGRDFWVFYGQYALLRDLLFGRSYQPLPRGEWEEYRGSWQRGQTYYGRDATADTPKYGSAARTTQERYAGSSYANGGGFGDSKYASRPGGYGDSKYATPGARDSRAREGRTFGRRNEPDARPPGGSDSRSFGRNSGSSPRSPSPGYHPAPRSAPRPSAPSRSGGRSFGSGRRR